MLADNVRRGNQASAAAGQNDVSQDIRSGC
jgi:hypothetical protein